MTKRGFGLGRGLGALGLDADSSDLPSGIDVAEICANKFQPRRTFDEVALNELAQSIKLHGVIQPIVVRKLSAGYELVAGERRLRAAKLAGLITIPAIVRDYSDGEMTEIALIENLQREDLNVIEEALAYRMLMEEFSLTQEEVARKIGRSRSHIANTVRLLNLNPTVQEYVSRGTLTMGQVRPLLSLEDLEFQLDAANTIIEEELSARDAEELVRRLAKTPQPPRIKKIERRELFLAEAEDRLKMALGTPVKIKPGKIKSKIEIEYRTAEELERIIEVLAAQQMVAATKVRGSLVV